MRTGRSLTVCRSLLPRGVSLAVSLVGGVSLAGGWYPSMHWGRPPMDRITDTSKNVNLATTSLRPVTRMHSSRMCTTRSSCHWGVCLSACWYRHPPPPGVGLETPLPRSPSTSPLGVGLETPPQPDVLNFPLGCGPGDPSPARSPQLLPLDVGLETCKACWDTTPTPMNRMTDRHL